MEKFMPYIWILVLLVSVIAETLSRKLIVIWLAPAAAISLILGWCGLDVWVQALAFFVISTLAILLFGALRHSRARGNERSGGAVEDTIGQSGQVIERIDNLAGCGQIEINGQFWAARAINESITFEVGCTVEVLAVEGVKLIVK